MDKVNSKLPFLAGMDKFTLPCSLSLEQASSQATAEFKATILRDIGTEYESFIDMTGGMGVDTMFLSPLFKKAIYIEQNAELCSIATSNFKAMGIENIEVVCADSTQYISDIEHASVIYADPARRSHSGGKLVSISDCEPNLLPFLDVILPKCGILMVKLSPMLDITIAEKELKGVTDLYVVSVQGECKELLAICSKDSVGSISIHCVNLPETTEFTFTKEEEQNAAAPLSMPLKYLYEPNASILKAGAFKVLCSRFGVNKLHTSSHLYTSEHLITGFPGRTFEIEDIRKVHKEYFKDIEKANITTRNFPTSVAELRKKLGIKEGGDIYMFATTLINSEKRMLICKKSTI
ncbi:MAG: class I SAM-dependent methyltransferase [Paludibacteraceae bacterium]|nr:class I SAM-dependent methyltransferase [Paludibacteraceae bacterium]